MLWLFSSPRARRCDAEELWRCSECIRVMAGFRHLSERGWIKSSNCCTEQLRGAALGLCCRVTCCLLECLSVPPAFLEVNQRDQQMRLSVSLKKLWPDTVSFSGDIQDPPGHGPVQPALGDPALAGGLDWVTHRGPFQPLPCWDSVPQ